MTHLNYVQISVNAIVTDSGAVYTGIADKTSWNFSTVTQTTSSSSSGSSTPTTTIIINNVDRARTVQFAIFKKNVEVSHQDALFQKALIETDIKVKGGTFGKVKNQGKMTNYKPMAKSLEVSWQVSFKVY